APGGLNPRLQAVARLRNLGAADADAAVPPRRGRSERERSADAHECDHAGDERSAGYGRSDAEEGEHDDDETPRTGCRQQRNEAEASGERAGNRTGRVPGVRVTDVA